MISSGVIRPFIHWELYINIVEIPFFTNECMYMYSMIDGMMLRVLNTSPMGMGENPLSEPKWTLK